MSVQEVNKTTGETSLIAGATLYADSPIGTILPFGGATAPEGWFLCQGQAISRTEYSDLFAVIGTSFGAGDGSTTFKLPDMRESVPKGAGLTSKSGNHMDADGLAVGEFLDDRVQNHTHDFDDSIWRSSGTGGAIATGSYQFGTFTATGSVSNSYRKGDTTEVKSVGVNFIIKAKMVALPLDMQEALDGKQDVLIFDIVPQENSINPVTSGGIYDKFKQITDYLDETLVPEVNRLDNDKLDKTGDSKDNVTAFTSSDVADGSATSWTSVTKLATGEKHSSIFAKMSQMFKNIRFLYKKLGTTDISSIGNGTVTGAVSQLNNDLNEPITNLLSSSVGTIIHQYAYPIGKHMIACVFRLELTSAVATNGPIAVTSKNFQQGAVAYQVPGVCGDIAGNVLRNLSGTTYNAGSILIGMFVGVLI